MSTTHPFDDQLRDLWSKRTSLDEAGWQHLYEIVVEVLSPFRPKELAGLPEDRAVYVHDFFMDKVFRLDSLSTCKHVGALRVYYQRFLRDRLDSEKRRDGLEVIERRASDEPVDPLLNRSQEHDPAGEQIWIELHEIGLPVEKVRTSAVQWLQSAEVWIPAYLALHFCPDAELSEPLCKLAKRLNVKSYHRKAVQLGISWAVGNTGNAGIKFEETSIGQWITRDLSLPITSENTQLIHAVLKILCLEALNWSEQQEAGL